VDEFEGVVLENELARKWLRSNLSAAFAAGSTSKRFFHSQKLWMYTGLVTLDKGTYEVIYKLERRLNATLKDPTNTFPFDMETTYK
jgi:hypothetical protein